MAISSAENKTEMRKIKIRLVNTQGNVSSYLPSDKNKSPKIGNIDTPLGSCVTYNLCLIWAVLISSRSND